MNNYTYETLKYIIDEKGDELRQRLSNIENCLDKDNDHQYYIDNELQHHQNEQRLQVSENRNEKFNIILRELSVVKNYKSEIKLIHSSIEDTRKIIYIIKNDIENQLRKIDLKFKDDQDDMPITSFSSGISQFEGSKKKNKQQDELNILTMKVAKNCETIDQIKQMTNQFQEKYENRIQKLEKDSDDKQIAIEELRGFFRTIQLENTGLNSKFSEINRKIDNTINQVSSIERDNKQIKKNLEEEFNSKIYKIEKENLEVIQDATEKLQESIVLNKSQLEEKLTKISKKELEILKKGVLTEVKDNIIEKAMSDVVKEIEKAISSSESKNNYNLKEQLSIVTNKLEEKIFNMKEFNEKLSLEQMSISSTIDAINKKLDTLNNYNDNKYSVNVNSLNSLTGNSNSKRGVEFKNDKIDKTDRTHKVKENKNDIKNQVSKQNQFINDSDDEDNLMSQKNSLLDESTKVKNKFSRFTKPVY